MSDDLFDRLTQMSLDRLALLALEQQERIEALEAAAQESDEHHTADPTIAVIGMSCRLPGAPNLDAYWELLRNGVDAVREITPDRWDIDEYYDPDPDVAGHMATRWAGLVDDLDKFDPHFFGISPREARTIDPQQRLLMEVAWEALEHAGISPDSLFGSLTGSYVGLCNADYAQMLLSGDPRDLDMYMSTGNADSVASGRLSYVLGLQGPALTVDTACSSSLVATHLAIQALRSGDCDLALAGGANAILSPQITMALSSAKMMASDGRCKAFDQRADGFVRGEGCGVLVLKRLADAEADGDRVLAVLRGSAVNQDGRSNGITAPNGPSQVSVITAALVDAGVDAGSIGYVEAHGTGTSLGDPIEAQALGAALGAGRTADDRLLIGSAKTNLGHLESAAGVAGLLKVILSMQHGEVPASLHMTEPNPLIPWGELPIDVVTERRPWPDAGRALAGVSSFGFSGTNAHVIVEPAPERAVDADARLTDGHAVVIPISAADPAALDELAQGFEQLLADPDVLLADIASTASTGRSHHRHRIALVAADREEALASLAAARSGDEDALIGRAGARPPSIGFLFTGHGSHYASMGVELHATDSAYRDAFDACAAHLLQTHDLDLFAHISAVDAADGSHPLDRMAIAQPALFAVEYSLARMWQAWGIEPDVVLGHSVGEYVAAVIAGVMSLEDGLRLVATRGALMDTLPAEGAMASILTSEAAVINAITTAQLSVHIAAVNGPHSVAVSGTPEAIATLLERCADDGVETRPLSIPVAAHSPQIDPILDEFERVAATVKYHAPLIDIVSGRTGKLATGDDLVTARYWRDHLRQPVRFADAFTTAYEEGVRVFVEAGPHPTLLNMGRHILPEAIVANECTWLPSLRSGRDDRRTALDSLAQLYTLGAPIEWTGVVAGSGSIITLPSYPFQRERYWATTAPTLTQRRNSENPLLGQRLESPAVDGYVFETELSTSWPQWLDDHRVHGVSILPSPAMLEMARLASAESGEQHDTVEQLAIREPLIVPDDGHIRVQVLLLPGPVETSFEIVSSKPSDSAWTVHASGVLRTSTGQQPDEFDSIGRNDLSALDDSFYPTLAEFGLGFGETFRGLTAIWADDRSAIGLIQATEPISFDRTPYAIHPAMLDACLHLLGAPGDVRRSERVSLLIAVQKFRWFGPVTGDLWCRATLRPDGSSASGSLEADVQIQNVDGGLVAEAIGVHLRLADETSLRKSSGRHLDDRVYEIEWQPFAELTGSPDPLHTLSPDTGLDDLARQLPERTSTSEMSTYLPFVDALDQLAGAYGTQTLLEVSNVEITPRYAPLITRLRALIATQKEVSSHSPEELLSTLRDRYPAHLAELSLVERCGRGLGDVLRGATEPLDLLFPGGRQSDVEHLYRGTPIASVANELVGETVRALADATHGSPLRILELGAGTGATTDAVLAALGDRPIEYVFTDVGPSFISQANARYNSRGDIRCAVLDAEQDFHGQGIHANEFDLVIAANVLHATNDVSAVVRRIRDTLRTNGSVVLLESIIESLWVTTTFGLTDGWWRFVDTELRPDQPLLDHATWLEVLTNAGFETPRSIAGSPGGDVGGQSVFVASMPSVAQTPLTDLIIGHPGTFRDDLVASVELGGSNTVVLDDVSSDAALAPYLTSGSTVGRIIVLTGIDDDGEVDAGQAMEAATTSTVALLTAVQAAVSTQSSARVWSVTRGTQPVRTPVTQPHYAAVWGLGRGVSLEHPDNWGGSIDLAPDSTPSDATAVFSLIDRGAEDQLAVRDMTTYVPRLSSDVTIDQTSPATIRADGTYIVTGGLGGLGQHVAGWLAARGAGTIVLTGRQGLPERTRWDDPNLDPTILSRVANVREMEAAGATVIVEAIDTADAEAMFALTSRCGNELHPVRGIIHCAAALSDHQISELTHDVVADMLHPKVAGTWILDAATADQPLDFVVLFSSTTAVWGSVGLAHYSSANAVLDAYAQYKATRGGPWASVNWGTWDEMRIVSIEERSIVERGGLHAMELDDALEQLGHVIAARPAQVAIADVDWDLLKPLYEIRQRRPFFSLVGTNDDPVDASTAGPKGGAGRGELADRLAETDPEQHRAMIEEFLTIEVARSLELTDPTRIDISQGLFEMGMDSLMSVELKGRVDRSLGVTLPSTITFNYPTVAELTGYLLDLVATNRDEHENDSSENTAAADPSSAAPPASVPNTPVRDDLEEDELESLLAERLAGLQDRLGEPS